MLFSEAPCNSLLLLGTDSLPIGFKIDYDGTMLWVDISNLTISESIDPSLEIRLMDNEAIRFAIMNPIKVAP